MLQLSDICKMGEDVQMATELIERTLFAMEASFHSMFSLTSGTSRLDYRRQENRDELAKSCKKTSCLKLTKHCGNYLHHCAQHCVAKNSYTIRND
jgi:hypothetical protein